MIIDNRFHINKDFIKMPRKYNDLLLYQLGEIYCESGAVVESHQHADFFEMTYVVSGKGVIYSNHIPQAVEKFDLYLSLPGDTHEIFSDNISPLRYYFFSFSFSPDSAFHKIVHDPQFLRLDERTRRYNESALEVSFRDLLSSIEDGDELADVMLELQAKTLAVRVVRAYKNTLVSSYVSPDIGNEQFLCHKIISFIDNHVVTMTQLTEISERLNYNYTYLSRIFKKHMKTSIFNYYMDKKLNIAKQLLADDKMSVTQISEYLNYSSIYVFSRVFKKKFGVSPSVYRSQISGKAAEAES